MTRERVVQFTSWLARHASRKTLGGVMLMAVILSLGTAIHFRTLPPNAISSPALPTLQGIVIDEHGSVPGALVRIQGHSVETLTDVYGAFAISHRGGQTGRVTACKVGYWNAGVTIDEQPLVIRLRSLPPADNVDYEWLDHSLQSDEGQSCNQCHGEIDNEWRSSAHAHSATNPRFLNLYDGTDWHGAPDIGWSLSRDYPHGRGVCAPCHAPGIPFEHGASDDLRELSEVSKHGVHCDFCHKIQEVVSEKFGLAHGRFGFRMLRPKGEQIFFGPLKDVDRGEEIYSAVYQESRYCAPCHEGTVFGVHVYGTYSEWLASPARKEGRNCQSCHMAPTGTMANIAPNAGGIARDPNSLASHQLLPGGHLAMLQRCLNVDVSLQFGTSAITCRVTVLASQVGHRVPTGFIDRHLILVVEGFDLEKRPIAGNSKYVLPAAAGRELMGMPGRIYGRILKDEAGNEPIPFWRPSESLQDTRLLPEQPIAQAVTFPTGTQTIRVRLLYRRFWEEVRRTKKWPDDSILVYDRRFEVSKIPAQNGTTGGSP